MRTFASGDFSMLLHALAQALKEFLVHRNLCFELRTNIRNRGAALAFTARIRKMRLPAR